MTSPLGTQSETGTDWERLFHEVKWDRHNVEVENDRYREALERIAAVSTFQPGGVQASAVMRGIAQDALTPTADLQGKDQ